MKNKTLGTIITIIVILAIIIIAWYFVKNSQDTNNDLVNNDNVSLNETIHDEDINNNNTDNNNGENETNYDNDAGLSLENPQANEVVSSPIDIEGEATGPWYFEANFGLKLVNEESGDIIAQSYVTALDDWMTEESVDFNGTLEYEVDQETEALLILESANPSGLAENQMTYTVPLTLSASN